VGEPTEIVQGMRRTSSGTVAGVVGGVAYRKPASRQKSPLKARRSRKCGEVTIGDEPAVSQLEVDASGRMTMANSIVKGTKFAISSQHLPCSTVKIVG